MHLPPFRVYRVGRLPLGGVSSLNLATPCIAWGGFLWAAVDTGGCKNFSPLSLDAIAYPA